MIIFFYFPKRLILGHKILLTQNRLLWFKSITSLLNLRCHVSIVIEWVKYLVISGRIEGAGVLRVRIWILLTVTTQSRAHQTDAEVFICRKQNRERLHGLGHFSTDPIPPSRLKTGLWLLFI